LDLRSPLTINFNLIAANAPELVENLEKSVIENFIRKNPILCKIEMSKNGAEKFHGEDVKPGKKIFFFFGEIFYRVWGFFFWIENIFFFAVENIFFIENNFFCIENIFLYREYFFSIAIFHF